LKIKIEFRKLKIKINPMTLIIYNVITSTDFLKGWLPSAKLKPLFLVGILLYSILLIDKIPTKKAKVGFRLAMASQPFECI